MIDRLGVVWPHVDAGAEGVEKSGMHKGAELIGSREGSSEALSFRKLREGRIGRAIAHIAEGFFGRWRGPEGSKVNRNVAALP